MNPTNQPPASGRGGDGMSDDELRGLVDEDMTNPDKDETDVIRCPKCQSTNWYCSNERHLDCWRPDGEWGGVKVVGYLACKDCKNRWADVSVEADDDCECDDD